MKESTEKIYRLALALSVFTIIYNILEGVFSIYLGAEDETLTLFGFGADSIIEVVSGIGIYFMIRRIQQSPQSDKSTSEVLALK